MSKYFIALCLLLSACTSGQKEKEAPLVRVEAVKAEEKEVPIFIQSIGNVVEKSIVQIRPQVQGVLLKAYVKQGQDVKKGDLLYKIDPRPYQAALDEAKGNLERDQANLEQAKITLKRNKELVKKKYIPVLTFEQYETSVKTAEAQVKISEAEVEKATINLDWCTIISPISGKVSVFNIYPGNLVLVNDTQSITEIRELDPINVKFTLTQEEFQQFQEARKKGDLEFEAALPNEKGKTFIGKINFIDNHIDLATGTIMFKGVVNNAKRELWPGEFVNVKIILKTEPHAIVVPSSALQVGAKGSFVYVVQKDKTARAVPVKRGEVMDSMTVVTGIHKGDIVVTNGQNNLKEGAKVRIIQRGQK